MNNTSTETLSKLVAALIDFNDDPRDTEATDRVASTISAVRSMSCDENLAINQIDAIFTAIADGRYTDMTSAIEALRLNVEIASAPIDARLAHEIGQALVAQWYQNKSTQENVMPVIVSNEDLVDQLVTAASKKNLKLVERLRQRIIDRSADQVAAARDCDRLIEASHTDRADDIVPSAAADILSDMEDE